MSEFEGAAPGMRLRFWRRGKRFLRFTASPLLWPWSFHRMCIGIRAHHRAGLKEIRRFATNKRQPVLRWTTADFKFRIGRERVCSCTNHGLQPSHQGLDTAKHPEQQLVK